MKLSVEKQRLQLMHDALDKQLQSMNVPGNSFKIMKQSVDSEMSINSKGSRIFSKDRQNVFQPKNGSNRKQQINQLQRKLIELQKKMQCIDIQDEEQDSNANRKFKQFIRTTKQNHRQDSIGKNPQEKKNSIQTLEKYKKVGILKNKPQNNIKHQSQSSSEEDIQLAMPIKRQPLKKLMEQGKKKQQINHSEPNKQIMKSNEDQDLNYLEQRYPPSKRSRSISKKKQKPQRKLSTNKLPSQRISQQKRKSVDFSRNTSQKSFNSQRRSLDKSGSFSIASFKNESGNKKQLKKIQNLQNQVAHYKRLVKKLQGKVKELQVIQIEHRKLQKNFAKSQTIRKQQKKLIESMKCK